MGKPYGHQYFFSESGCSTGTMVCEICHQPIFNHSQDWMSYQKSCKDEAGWPDWAFHCFHRKCTADQSGWRAIERKAASANKRAQAIKADLLEVAAKYKIQDGYSFAELAADALGCDLEDYLN